MNDPLLAVDAMNFWAKTAKSYENESNRLAHEGSALEHELPITHPDLKESTKVLADCKYMMSQAVATYARALRAHGAIISKLVEEANHESRDSSRSVPSEGTSSGTPSAT